MLCVVYVMTTIVICIDVGVHDKVVLKPKRMLNPLQVNLPLKP
jgi:hypothetical protein